MCDILHARSIADDSWKAAYDVIGGNGSASASSDDVL